MAWRFSNPNRTTKPLVAVGHARSIRPFVFECKPVRERLRLVDGKCLPGRKCSDSLDNLVAVAAAAAAVVAVGVAVVGVLSVVAEAEEPAADLKNAGSVPYWA